MGNNYAYNFATIFLYFYQIPFNSLLPSILVDEGITTLGGNDKRELNLIWVRGLDYFYFIGFAS